VSQKGVTQLILQKHFLIKQGDTYLGTDCRRTDYLPWTENVQISSYHVQTTNILKGLSNATANTSRVEVVPLIINAKFKFFIDQQSF
jgi:hypothetical protein